MKPSTGAAVRLHRNAVRDRPESLSAFKWNACPPSPEYPTIGSGVEFIDENSGGEGVRFRKPQRYKKKQQ
jgi:hypothetical protein